MKRFIAVSVLIMAAAMVAFGQCSDADKKKLEALDRTWGDAGQRGDQAFLKNVYADEYMNLSPAGTLTKTEAIDNAVKAAERNKTNPNPDRVSHDYYVITCSANSATI